MDVTERRLDVGESRRAFGDGTMKDTPPQMPPITAVEGSWGYEPVIEKMQAREAERRKRLARWQVPRV